MCQRFVDKKERSIPIFLVKDFTQLELTPFQKNWTQLKLCAAEVDDILLLPDAAGKLEKVYYKTEQENNMWLGAHLAEKLPAEYTYYFSKEPETFNLIAIAWGLASYIFNHYKSHKKNSKFPMLYVPATLMKEVEATVSATIKARDLINMSAADLTPKAIAQEVMALGKRFNAEVSITEGEMLLTKFPMVHAVGRASVHAPCVAELSWGNPKNPTVTLIGKGVTFDTGGLDIKPPGNMLLMKKDMGGAAHALGLAQLIMEMGLPIHLRLILPCAENAISGNAYRPSDVLVSRKGITVEVADTDAEGRLLLADALTAATEDKGDLIIDFAT